MAYNPDKEPEQPAPILAKFDVTMALIHLKGQLGKTVNAMVALLPYVEDQDEMITLQAKIAEAKGAAEIAEDWRIYIAKLEVVE